jgi:hypothetical protein
MDNKPNKPLDYWKQNAEQEKFNRMENIHVIPTDKPSRLLLSGFGTLFLTPPIEFKSSDKYQNIYITSDKEIKEGDYIGYPTLNNWVPIKYLGGDLIGSEKKIILTTDPDLIKDGIQAIDDTFLEWFVKNPSCEYVKIDKLVFYEHKNYKIIIPKEEAKQETNISNITANQLIKDWKKTLESEWIQLDNLDKAKLVFDEKGNVVVENEHGTQFPVSDLSNVELDIFYTNLIYQPDVDTPIEEYHGPENYPAP